MTKIPDSNLLIFSKYPLAGKAKTRLIPALGAQLAAQLHRRLAESTLSTARSWKQEGLRESQQITVCYTGETEAKFRSWFGPDLNYQQQPTGDLGQRMASAFQTSLVGGAHQTLGIGTDTPAITPDILRQAHESLKHCDIVLGPAIDGGYYLIGMNTFHPELFTNIEWGSAHVYAQTIEACTHLGLHVINLPKLSDIDRAEDLLQLENDPRFSDTLNNTPLLSIIIPTLNEAAVLGRTLKNLQRSDHIEIIVADGGSQDITCEIAHQHGVHVITTANGRSEQLNQGAKTSRGRYLLFLHADTQLPHNYEKRIFDALSYPHIVAGAFRFKTDSPRKAMRIVEWGTNLRSTFLKWPYGDQGLFMEKRIFDELGGFPTIPIMEDFELIRRLRRRGQVVTLAEAATTSARRWKNLGIVRTTIVNQLMIIGFLYRVPAESLRRLYRHK